MKKIKVANYETRVCLYDISCGGLYVPGRNADTRQGNAEI